MDCWYHSWHGDVGSGRGGIPPVWMGRREGGREGGKEGRKEGGSWGWSQKATTDLRKGKMWSFFANPVKVALFPRPVTRLIDQPSVSTAAVGAGSHATGRGANGGMSQGVQGRGGPTNPHASCPGGGDQSTADFSWSIQRSDASRSLTLYTL